MSTHTTVILTGASGYLGQNIVKELIKANYQVVGTVRSVVKGEAIVKDAGKQFSYEIVEDIGVANAFDGVLKKHPEASVFIHSASPVTIVADDPENEIINPSVNGVKNALKSVKEFGPQIKNLVLTSSIGAVIGLDDHDNENLVVTEETWNPITWDKAITNGVFGYYGSKTFAEKAAWDFVKEQKPPFTLSSVIPAFILGPQAYESQVKSVLRTSAEYVNGILNSKPGDELPYFVANFIDVRDVAKAHIVAFENPEAANQRLILADTPIDIPIIAKRIVKLFPQFEGKISTGGPVVKETTFAKVDDVKSRKILGFDYYTLNESIKNAVDQILAVDE